MHLANAYMVAVVAMACCSRDDIPDLEQEPGAALAESFTSHKKAHGLGALVEHFKAYIAAKAAAAGA